MNKAFDNFTWYDSPSTDSPISANNLNKINSALNTVDNRVITLDTDKQSATDSTLPTTSKTVVGSISEVRSLALAKADKPDMGTVTLSTSWTGSASPYSQTVTVSGATITSNSKVDIQPDSAAIAQMISDGTNALYISNNNGTLTAYAVGSAPTAAMTLQVCVTEVVA